MIVAFGSAYRMMTAVSLFTESLSDGLLSKLLDDWINWFKLQVFERHNASADAMATAELALILFNRVNDTVVDFPAAD